MKSSLPQPSLPASKGSVEPARWLQNLIQAYPLLTYSGLVMLVGFLLTLPLMVIDERSVLGINTWIKPAKFLLSTGIYLITMAWILLQLGSWNPKRSRRLSRGLAWVLNLEIVLIVTQGMRGVPSHFNQSTPVDALIFAAMGILILLASLIAMYLTWIAWSQKLDLDRPMLWAIRLGLTLLILSSFEGGFMVQAQQHAVGVADGGAGIPFLNWSTEGGDLRIAHFLGMHGLQLFPLLAYALRKVRGATAWVIGFGLLYSLFSLGVFGWAMLGRPLLTF